MILYQRWYWAFDILIMNEECRISMKIHDNIK